MVRHTPNANHGLVEWRARMWNHYQRSRSQWKPRDRSV